MAFRFARCIAAAAFATVMTWAFASPEPSRGQTTPPPATPAKPTTPTQTAPAEQSDAFGQQTTLTAQPMLYVKGSGDWDHAFQIISGAFKKLKAYTDKAGLKPNGLPMTIFTATDDNGFDYEAAVPLAEPPKVSPHDEIAVGQSPAGHALKFVHHGSYDDLDNTYEAITNYLDDKRIDAQDMFIEQYVTDPVSSDGKNLTVNVYVLVD